MAGRPTKYDPKFCNEIESHMGAGFSKESFAGKIGICKQTLYNWMNENPTFLDAVKRAEVACQNWWEQKGMDGMYAGKDFSSAIWIFNMKARFRWKDVTAHEVSGPDGKPIETKDVSQLTDEQIEAKIQEKLGKGKE